MIDLPQLRIESLNDFADWVELCVISDQGGVVSQADVADIVKDAGLLGTVPSELFPEDETFGEPSDTSDDDAAKRFAQDIWGVLSDRAFRMQTAYPFMIDGDLVRRTVDSWSDALSYTGVLLIANLARFSAEFGLADVDGCRYQQLFEKIVQACAAGLFKGTAVRFGFPRDADWPVAVKDRVYRLGEELDLHVESLEGKVYPSDRDISLDIVSRLSVGDDGPGMIMVLAQCAVGRHWRDKRGEPSFAEWRDVLRWDAKLVRAIAVPWWFENRAEYVKHFRHFDEAVMLDRPRLMAGEPDRSLDERYRPLLSRWCEGQLEKLPKLR